MTKAIIILAAGNGTRMKSSIPKPLHKIAGKTIISYIIKAALSSDVKEIVLVSSGNPNLDQEALSILPDIKIIHQVEKLGTGHAAKLGCQLVSTDIEEIQIIYGDTPLIQSQTLIKLSESLKNFDLSFLGFHTLSPHNYGRFITDDSKLLKIIEELDATAQQKQITLCNSGIVSGKKNTIISLLNLLDNQNAKKEYYLTKIASLANENSFRCGFVITEETEVLGINSKNELQKIENIKQSQLRNTLLDNGVTLIAPETVFLTDDTIIGQDSIIHPYVIFGEKVEIGESVEILSFSHIEYSQINNHCRIGPFARFRGNNIIGSNCHIGNFVEIKHSHLQDNVKASHLSYLGDSEIDDRVNIGAGAITCNYDGKKKNITKIGKDAFIGSNVNLIAPISIGNNSLIGAGSTITEDVPDNAWAIARSRQTILKNKNQET